MSGFVPPENELLMLLIRTGRGAWTGEATPEPGYPAALPLAHDVPLELPAAPTLEQTVCARYEAGHSQRAIARELNLDRRKVKCIPDNRGKLTCWRGLWSRVRRFESC